MWIWGVGHRSLITEGKSCPRERQLQVTGAKSPFGAAPCGGRCEVSLPIANS